MGALPLADTIYPLLTVRPTAVFFNSDCKKITNPKAEVEDYELGF